MHSNKRHGLFRYAKRVKTDHFQMFLLGLVTVAEGVLLTVTLGRVDPGWRAYLLFDVFDD